jgi:glycosyltransferase involved in cell wall biosynthesis
MRRLLIVTRTHAPHGGADRIVADVARELPARGWQVVLGLARGAVFNDTERYRDVLGRDLPAVEIDGRAGSRGQRVRSLRSAIRSERPDVVLSMRVFDAYEAVAAEKGDGRDIRLAVGIRSFEPAYLVDLAAYRDNVDLCVTSGALIAAAAVHHCGLDASRVVSIGGGVRRPRAQPRPRSPRRPLVLLYAGRIDNEQKRALDLVPLLDALAAQGLDVRLHVAGIGPAEQELRERLASHAAAGRVKFHGWVDRDRLYGELYPQADCFVHFAAWEGMTIAPREAMAHGVVPVISRFLGLEVERQFIDGRTALTFPVGDVRAAAACVARLVSEDGLLERLSAAAIKTQSGAYSFDGAMDAWAEALDRCMERPATLGPVPVVTQRVDGRLTRWGVPPGVQERLRALLRRPVVHASPGSEWPTSSGTMSESARRAIEDFARAIEERAA